MIYLVLVSKKGGFDVHSAHKSQAVAEQWAECLRYGGADASVAAMGKDQLTDLVALAEAK